MMLREIVKICRMLEQQEYVWGFVPLTDLQFTDSMTDSKCVQNRVLVRDPVALHAEVAKIGLPNFIGARIQLNYTMNLDLFQELLGLAINSVLKIWIPYEFLW